MPSFTPPREDLSTRDILLLVGIVFAGALVLVALLSLNPCLLGCPLAPLRH